MKGIHPFSCSCDCTGEVIIPGRMDIFAVYGGFTPSTGTVFSRCASIATVSEPNNGRLLEPLWGYERPKIRSLWQSLASWDGHTVWCQEQYNPCLYDDFSAAGTVSSVSLAVHTAAALNAPSAFFPDGIGWQTHTGSFIVNGSNIARQVGGGQPAALCSTDFTNSDAQITFGVQSATSGWIAILFRYVDATNYLRFRLDRTIDTIYLESVVAGSVTVLDSLVDATRALGGRIHIVCEGSSVEVKYEVGFTLTTFLSATTSAHIDATRLGVGAPAGSTGGTINYFEVRILDKDVKHYHTIYVGDTKVAEIEDDFFENCLIAGGGSKVLVSTGGLAPQESTGSIVFKEIDTGGGVTNINYNESPYDWNYGYKAKPRSDRRGYPTAYGTWMPTTGTPVYNHTFAYWETPVTSQLVIGEMSWSGLPDVGDKAVIHEITRKVRHSFFAGYGLENPPDELEVRSKAHTDAINHRLPDPLDADFATYDYDNTVPSYGQIGYHNSQPDEHSAVICYQIGSIKFSLLYIDGSEHLFKQGSHEVANGGPTFTQGEILTAHFAPGRCAFIHKASNGTYTFKIYDSGGEVYSSDTDNAVILTDSGIMAASDKFFYVKGIGRGAGTFNTTNGADSTTWLVSHDGTVRLPINQTSVYSQGGYLFWPGLGFDPRPFQLGGHLFVGNNIDVVKGNLPYAPTSGNIDYL